MSFVRYPRYKDSGVEWLGEVPEGWTVIQGKRIICSTGGSGTIKNLCASERTDGLYAGFSASGQDVWLDYYDFNVPGLVLSAVGARCGKTFLASGQWGTTANTHCLFPRDGADLKFLWYLTNIHLWWEIGGTAQPFVKVAETLSRIWAFPIPSEQAVIGRFLDQETAKIDALIEEQRRLIELLKEKRQAVISHAVAGRLTSNPQTTFRSSSIQWFSQVPSEWTDTPLKWLTQQSRPIMYGIVLPGPDVGKGIPILKGGNIKPHRMCLEEMARTTPEIEAPFARARLKAGDLAYAIRGTIGDCEFVPLELEDANITQDVARIAVRDDVDRRWVRWVLLSSAVREKLACGSLSAAVRGINIIDLKRAKAPLPPISEQCDIANLLDQEDKQIEGLIAAATQNSLLLQERRSALISAAVTGKIDVRNDAPQLTAAAAEEMYEPA